jgi:hypothetical protein
VRFRQLKCHIEDNWAHYFQALWRKEHPDQRLLRLPSYGSLSSIVDNEVLGFVGHKAGYRISDLQAARRWIDFETVIREVTDALEGEEPTVEQISLPTPEPVLEALVGQCDACEGFIQQNRVIDLRRQEPEAEQQGAEARRRAMWLDADPPDLSDPKAPASTRFVVKIEQEGGEPSP